METHSKLQLIYDRDCPLCKWYSSLFVKYGFLENGGRLAFQDLEGSPLNLDRELAQNKIALLDYDTKQVTYGLDSLLKVIGRRIPLVEKAGKFQPLHFLLSLLYAFISYNRKAFAPSACNGSCSCYPSRSIFWRIVLIAGAGLYVNHVTWTYFSEHLDPYFIGKTYWIDSIFYSTQFVFLFLVFRLFRQRNFYDYAGQIAVISLLAAFLLHFFHLGFVLLAFWGVETGMLEAFCYGMVYLFMLYEHKKRCEILGIHWLMSIAWILFRFAIYPFAFTI